MIPKLSEMQLKRQQNTAKQIALAKVVKLISEAEDANAPSVAIVTVFDTDHGTFTGPGGDVVTAVEIGDLIALEGFTVSYNASNTVLTINLS